MRQPEQKKLAWVDLKMVREKIKNLKIKLYKKNLIAGVDEVGRGSLAGPVVAAAVIFKNSHMINGIRDSKNKL